MIRALAEALSFRSRLASIAGKTFGGNRDLYKTLGYSRRLSVQDFRDRFDRNEVANRVVKAFPQATWRGGCEVIEDENPETETTFEREFADLDNRLKIWDTFRKVDILSGIGRYAVIQIVAPGNMSDPLETVAADDIAELWVFGEDEAKVLTIETEKTNPRYGKPVFYSITRTAYRTRASLPGSTTRGLSTSLTAHSTTRSTVSHGCSACGTAWTTWRSWPVVVRRPFGAGPTVVSSSTWTRLSRSTSRPRTSCGRSWKSTNTICAGSSSRVA